MGESIFWLVALIVFAVGEAVTVGLTSVWFALGSLGALIVSGLGFGIWPQVIVFVVLSAVSMALIRPIAKKILAPHYAPTNADRVIGTTGLVTEAIDNIEGRGQVNLSGQIWSARSSQPDGVIPAGQEVKVLKIRGVKVIVEPVAGKTN
mgnify:CR=1 FL=1